ncbi:MAG: hypothetical protein JRJ47_08335 [Deltaproteobacteria bacterium]|nr:hypothetical protein [Deltaproteobacteria bacterium]
MNPEKTYQYLEELAEKAGISIRYEALTGSKYGVRSGLCRIKGKNIYIMDSSQELSERITALSKCLASVDLEGIYVVPAVRELLERARSA